MMLSRFFHESTSGVCEFFSVNLRTGVLRGFAGFLIDECDGGQGPGGLLGGGVLANVELLTGFVIIF